MPINLFDLLERYAAERTPRPDTFRHYQWVVDVFVRETGLKSLDANLDRTPILNWRDRVLERARPVTWNNYLRHLRALGNLAVELKYLDENPFLSIRYVREGRPKPKVVSPEEIHEAIRHLNLTKTALQPSWFWSVVVRTLYYTGMRRRQLVTIRWQDVDLDQKLITLTVEGSKTHREWDVPLNDELVDSIKILRDKTMETAGPAYFLRGQVFNVTLFYSRYSGSEMSSEQVSGFFKRLAKSMGSSISPHRLRHGMATQLAKTGSVQEVQQILGHTDVRTTFKYIHPDNERLRDLLEQLPESLCSQIYPPAQSELKI